MPVLSELHIESLKPLIGPFEGHKSKTVESHLLEGEGHNDEFLPLIHDGKDNNDPKQFVKITVEELKKHKVDVGNSFADKCFLWVIDKVSIKILWEKTPNVLRTSSRPEKPYVCHTNITGGQKAYIGGEMYFCEDGNIYVNFSSDRYGTVATEEKKKMAMQYIADCNYKNLKRAEPNP